MQDTIKQILLRLIIFSIMTCSTTLLASNHIKFNDVASIVIADNLSRLPKNNFLRELYTHLFFLPAWIEEDSPSALSEELFDEIIKDKTLPLSSKLMKKTLHIMSEVKEMYARYSKLREKMELEFKISKLYKEYASYVLYGKINWTSFKSKLYSFRKKGIKADWVTYKPESSPISLLVESFTNDNLTKMLKESKPTEYHYKELEKELYKYLKIANQGGWGHIAVKRNLRPNKSYKNIPALRKRLRKSGDYGESNPKGNLYDASLKKAVIRFQKRHGLLANGVVNKRTYKALNIPVEVRIKEIRLNLDRIKWLHQRHAKRHIVINIPSFTLFFEEDAKLLQTMKVVVGKIKKPTPIFSGTVETIVLNPSWNIPKSIIRKEMIPKLIKNPNAMAQRGIVIYKSWSRKAVKINGSSVDWSKYRNSKSMPFHFAQVPGVRNALGKVKFLFPNKFSVYMHDTPSKHLFKRNIRAFSHGCIRLQKPRELLKTFATFNASVDFKRSQKRLKGRSKAYLKLDNPVPVDIVYLTAYVDYDGVLQFRDDIYGYDKMQLQSYKNW